MWAKDKEHKCNHKRCLHDNFMHLVQHPILLPFQGRVANSKFHTQTADIQKGVRKVYGHLTIHAETQTKKSERL